jgi:hypothetical protein
MLSHWMLLLHPHGTSVTPEHGPFLIRRDPQASAILETESEIFVSRAKDEQILL